MFAGYLRELCDYWKEGYNWRREEQKLNQLAHSRTEIDGAGIHFVHERGKGPAPFPLILTHGYPDSFYRFVKLVPLLTDPTAFGGRAEDAFDVVVPDIPGYGFSDKPDKRGSTFGVSDLWARLMTERLGYERFGAHGGHLLRKPDDPSPAEQKLFKKSEEWLQKEGAYALIQSTKPQSLAPGLSDSLAGLAAWIVEKFRAWSDGAGNAGPRCREVGTSQRWKNLGCSLKTFASGFASFGKLLRDHGPSMAWYWREELRWAAATGTRSSIMDLRSTRSCTFEIRV
jgi:microsomal epoxide hydrolase